jgi:hypothetical protein
MANEHISRRVVFGLKKEAVRGTAETSGFTTIYKGEGNFTKSAVSVKSNSALGRIEIDTDGRRVEKLMASGSLNFPVIDYSLIGMPMTALFGAPSTTGTTNYVHTWSDISQSNLHPSYTIVKNEIIESDIIGDTFPLGMIESATLEWSSGDGEGEPVMSLNSEWKTGVSDAAKQDPTLTTATTIPRFIRPTELVFSLGSGGSSAATETTITGLTLNFAKNLKVVYGSNIIASTIHTSKALKPSEIVNQGLGCTGSFTKVFNTTDEVEAFLQQTHKSLKAVWTYDTNTNLTVELLSIFYDNAEITTGLDDLVMLTVPFTAGYSRVAGKMLTAVLKNQTASY